MSPTSIKFPDEMLRALRAIAAAETLRRLSVVTWAALVREAVQKHVIDPNRAIVGAGVGREVTP